MSVPTFHVTKDHLSMDFEGDKDVYNRTGMTYWVEARGNPDPPDKLPIDFRLYDDDGELYYEGRCNEDGIELAFDWGAIDAGCTRIDTREGTAPFEQTIS